MVIEIIVACICSFAVGWCGGWSITSIRNMYNCHECMERLRHERMTEDNKNELRKFRA